MSISESENNDSISTTALERQHDVRADLNDIEELNNQRLESLKKLNDNKSFGCFHIRACLVS
ncbi:6041_t:CDS:1, partial [Ambispora leptoticha]